MARTPVPPDLLPFVAERFRALAEPARLHLLNALRRGERTVSALVDDTGLSQANVSKHLRVLYDTGFVDRRKDGLYVYYRMADDDVLQLCNIMCGRVEGARPYR